MDLLIILVSLFLILGCIDLLSSFFFYRSRNYMWVAKGVFTLLFVGYWVYRIQQQSTMVSSRRMELKEQVFSKSIISKARETLLAHNLWDFYLKDKKTFDREDNHSKQIQSIILLACCVQISIVLFRLGKGKRKFPQHRPDYQKQIKFYWIMLGFCVLVYLLPFIVGV